MKERGMNKYQRIKKRIERDKLRKQMKLLERNILYGDFDSIITYQNFVEALKKCKVGVNWKGSVQVYTEKPISEISKARKKLIKRELPKITSFKKIVIYERGKARIIVPIKIQDRMIQRVICDNALVPMFKDYLIYDNGASTKGKGVEFARARLETHIRKAQKKYGSDNLYALVFDFKNFFGSIPHKTCLNVLHEKFIDSSLINIIMDIIKSYSRNDINTLSDKELRDRKLKLLEGNNLAGICLGSQISQIMALVVPNKLDHFVKDQCGMKHYMRYMDDGIILFNDKKALKKLYSRMKIVCERLGLTFNSKKTRIVKMTKGITFMKIKYKIVGDRLVKKLSRSSIVRMRRKLKKFRKLVDNGKMKLNDVYNSIQSWVAHSKRAMSYKTRNEMLELYDKLFDGYKMTKRYNYLVENKIRGRNVPDEVLQDDKWYEYRWGSYAA